MLYLAGMALPRLDVTGQNFGKVYFSEALVEIGQQGGFGAQHMHYRAAGSGDHRQRLQQCAFNAHILRRAFCGFHYFTHTCPRCSAAFT